MIETNYPCAHCEFGTYMNVEEHWWCSKHNMYDCEMEGNRGLCEKFKTTSEDDAISRKAMLDYQQYLHGKMSNEENYKLWEFIKDLPSVIPAPKKCHNVNTDYAECDQFVCSNCGIELQDWHQVERDEDDGDITYRQYEFHFCPNCGAKIGERRMTRKEQNNKLKHLITCMKCEVSGKCCDENCPIQYDAGNIGEIIENLEEISKILERLDSCIEDAKSEGDFSYIKPFEIAKIAVQEVAKEYKGGWIPCGERLPEPQKNGDKDFSDWLQITIKIGHPVPKDAYVTEGYYCFSEKKWYTKRFVIGEVTAWMPLPEPYKAETEGEE